MIHTPRSCSLRRCAVLLPLLVLNACGASASPAYARTPTAKMADHASPPSAPAQSEAPSAAPSMPSRTAGMASPSPAPAPMAKPNTAPGSGPAAPVKGTGAAAPSDAKAKTVTTEPGAGVRAMLVFTGQMGLVVEHDQGPVTLDRTIDLAEKMGGHVASRVDNTVVIKVPSASFRETMNEIAKLGAVTKQSISTEDVTEEFHDGEVRLQNLKATRQRLQEFLAKATTISDALTVERELERVAQEIDRLEGRMRFLRERASYSQITLTVTPKAAPQPIVEVTPPKPAPVVIPPRKLLDLPAGWVSSLGVDGLLKLR